MSRTILLYLLILPAHGEQAGKFFEMYRELVNKPDYSIDPVGFTTRLPYACSNRFKCVNELK